MSDTSSVQGHDGEHHVLVDGVLSVQRLRGGYESVGVDGELGLPQVVDEGVGDLAKQPRVLVGGTDLAKAKVKVKVNFIYQTHPAPSYIEDRNCVSPYSECAIDIFTTQHRT